MASESSEINVLGQLAWLYTSLHGADLVMMAELPREPKFIVPTAVLTPNGVFTWDNESNQYVEAFSAQEVCDELELEEYLEQAGKHKEPVSVKGQLSFFQRQAFLDANFVSRSEDSKNAFRFTGELESLLHKPLFTDLLKNYPNSKEAGYIKICQKIPESIGKILQFAKESKYSDALQELDKLLNLVTQLREMGKELREQNNIQDPTLHMGLLELQSHLLGKIEQHISPHVSAIETKRKKLSSSFLYKTVNLLAKQFLKVDLSKISQRFAQVCDLKAIRTEQEETQKWFQAAHNQRQLQEESMRQVSSKSTNETSKNDALIREESFHRDSEVILSQKDLEQTELITEVETLENQIKDQKYELSIMEDKEQRIVEKIERHQAQIKELESELEKEMAQMDLLDNEFLHWSEQHQDGSEDDAIYIEEYKIAKDEIASRMTQMTQAQKDHEMSIHRLGEEKIACEEEKQILLKSIDNLERQLVEKQEDQSEFVTSEKRTMSLDSLDGSIANIERLERVIEPQYSRHQGQITPVSVAKPSATVMNEAQKNRLIQFLEQEVKRMNGGFLAKWNGETTKEKVKKIQDICQMLKGVQHVPINLEKSIQDALSIQRGREKPTTTAIDKFESFKKDNPEVGELFSKSALH